MSIKDLTKAWDDAAQRVLESSQETELAPAQLSHAAGLHVRTGLAAGSWGLSEDQTCTCNPRCEL